MEFVEETKILTGRREIQQDQLILGLMLSSISVVVLKSVAS